MLIIDNSILGFWWKSYWVNYQLLQKMNSAHSYSEGAEVPEDKTPEFLRLEKEWRWKRMDTIYNHNIVLVRENLKLKAQIQELQNELESLKNKPI